MPSWNELGNVFSTIRELDVTAIREEAERPVSVVCLGDRPIFDQLTARLRDRGANRHGPAGADPLRFRALSARGDDDLRAADLLLLLFDGRRPLSTAETAPLGRLAALEVPTVILIVGAAPGSLGPPRPEFAHAEIVVVPDLEQPAHLAALAGALLARVPEGLHLALARRLPGLRGAYAQGLVGSVSFSNASFATASALPQQIPILSVPFVAADMIVLTKNQALMVYRIALAHGASPEFQDRMAELGSVVGGGFLWRQLARSLIGLIPVWGVVPKVAVAYAGTYATGVAAWRWFADGEVLSRARLSDLMADAMRRGREAAAALAAAARTQGDQVRKRLPALPWPGQKAEKAKD